MRPIDNVCAGLATCYALVTLMSGSISYKSAVGAGTTFRIMLPLEAADMVGK
jgi:signal transduction histidine kinase